MAYLPPHQKTDIPKQPSDEPVQIVDVSTLFQKDPEPFFASTTVRQLPKTRTRRTYLSILLMAIILCSAATAGYIHTSRASVTSEAQPVMTRPQKQTSAIGQHQDSAEGAETSGNHDSEQAVPTPQPAPSPSPTVSSAPAKTPAPTVAATAPQPAPPTYHTVVYKNNCYSPSSISIKRGDIVTYHNDSTHDMWPASDNHPSHNIYPEFDARGNIRHGGTFSFTFNKTGTWDYHDHNKPKCGGTVTVQ